MMKLRATSYVLKTLLMFFLMGNAIYAADISPTYVERLYAAVGITPLEQEILRTDISISYLGNIFGSMSDLLVGNQQTIFGRLFYLFNIGCMALATISLSYSSMVIVVESAGEGAALGKKLQQSYFYLIFRQLSSIMLMTPQFNGYSGVQVLLMWMVVQGVYLADVVWLKTAEYVMMTQGIASNVLDVASENPSLAAAMNLSTTEQRDQPSQAQLEGARKTLVYAYQAAMCATFYPMTQGKAVSAISFSDLTISANYNSQQVFTGYSMVFPYNCGTITTSYNNLPSGLNVEAQAALLHGIQSSLQMSTQLVLDYIKGTLPMLQSSNCLATLATNMNISTLPSACLLACDTSPAGAGCPVAVLLLNATSQLASSVQMQAAAVEMASQPGADGKPDLASIYGIGWAGVATQYYRGVHSLQGSSTGSSSLSYSTLDYATLTATNFSGLVMSFVNNIDMIVNVIMKPPALPAAASSCDDVTDASDSFSIWYCQANTVKSQAQNIVRSLWSDIDVGSIGFDDSSTWDQLYNNYYGHLNSQTSDAVQWSSISPAFWPLMNIFHVSVSNVWIRTFLDPAYLKLMITDPLYTFSQMAKFLTAASISYMMKATGEVAKDMISFSNDVALTTTLVMLPYVIIDAILSDVQTYANYEFKACFQSSSMFFPLFPFCFLIFFIPINMFIGLLVNAVVTAIRLAVKIVFDTVLAVLYQLVEIGIAYKMRYMSLIFTVSSPVLTIASYLAVYIPMLPVLMYTIAIIGWFAAVIEAMIGVPLVLLGMTSMSGHDLFGSAQQTMILLLSVFLRPVTLVIGFIFGVMILSLFGFVMAMFIVPYLGSYLNILEQTNVDPITQAVILAAVMLMYLSVYATVIQLAFGAMFKIPYSIMRWIGLSGGPSGEEEVLEQIQSETRSQLGSMSGAFSGMQGGMSKLGGSAGTGKADIHEIRRPSQGRDDET